jgi:hypothetical protein
MVFNSTAKAVLPAISPNLNHSDLDGVKDGGGAADAYLEAIHAETSPERREQIRQELRTYCRLDTFALVRIWQVFSGRGEWKIADQK